MRARALVRHLNAPSLEFYDLRCSRCRCRSRRTRRCARTNTRMHVHTLPPARYNKMCGTRHWRLYVLVCGAILTTANGGGGGEHTRAGAHAHDSASARWMVTICSGSRSGSRSRSVRCAWMRVFVCARARVPALNKNENKTTTTTKNKPQVECTWKKPLGDGRRAAHVRYGAAASPSLACSCSHDYDGRVWTPPVRHTKVRTAFIRTYIHMYR